MREYGLPIAKRPTVAADAPPQLLDFGTAELRHTGDDAVQLNDRPRLALRPDQAIVVRSIRDCPRLASPSREQGTLGLAQWRIARAQKDIAYDKLKLDLFDKRYAIYQAALSLSRAFMPSNKRIPVESFEDLQYTLLEAAFFFPANVVPLARRIYLLSFEWQQQAEALDSVDDPLPEKLREEFLQRQALIPKEMGRLRIAVEGVFLPELAFKQLKRK